MTRNVAKQPALIGALCVLVSLPKVRILEMLVNDQGSIHQMLSQYICEESGFTVLVEKMGEFFFINRTNAET